MTILMRGVFGSASLTGHVTGRTGQMCGVRWHRGFSQKCRTGAWWCNLHGPQQQAEGRFYDNKCIHPTRVKSIISNPHNWRPMRFREWCRRWCHLHEPALVLELAWSSREQVTIRTSAMGHLWWQIDVRTSSERPCCWCLVLLVHVMDYMLCNDFYWSIRKKSHLKGMHCL